MRILVAGGTGFVGRAVCRALGVEEPTAVLEILETMHLTSGEALQHATDVFLPTGIDLHVIRGFAAERPEVIPPRD